MVVLALAPAAADILDLDQVDILVDMGILKHEQTPLHIQEDFLVVAEDEVSEAPALKPSLEVAPSEHCCSEWKCQIALFCSTLNPVSESKLYSREFGSFLPSA